MLLLTFDDLPIKSFIIVIYDAALEEVAQYQVPFSITAPFANRIAREVLNIPDWGATLHEPWYSLAYRLDSEYQRAAEPPGPTSLKGQRYDPDAGPGPSIQLHPDALVKSFEVRLFDYQKELYQGVYTVDDIFLHGARYLLHNRIQNGKLPGGGSYSYAVLPSRQKVHSVSSDLLPEDAYQSEGVFRLPPRDKDESSIKFTPVPPSPLAERDPAGFGVTELHGKGEVQTGRIFIPTHLYADLQRHLFLSQKKEEGGYILGKVFRSAGTSEQENAPGFRWIVEITDLLMAEDTIGSAATLLFTGDTWSKISRRRDRQYPGLELVGWFHTHLFPATDAFGLSSLDQDMHTWYLPRPWQIAILLNLEKDDKRTVRCYQRGVEGDLIESTFETFSPK
ncbi:MAG TPA: hypothetical protein VKT82_34155 [Ktedonobacterales bacterium]|nr:hypothetical protein [Ktedonobacterales bacterium]